MDLKERDKAIKELSESVEKISKYLDGLTTYLQKQEYANLVNDIKVSTLVEALISEKVIDKEVLDAIYKRIAQESLETLQKSQEEDQKSQEKSE